MNMRIIARIAPFVLGLVLGIVGTIFLPAYVRPHLPGWMTGSSVVVTGTVAEKQKKDASLLLTVETPSGVLLATFRKKVDEINLLISKTDTIEFMLPKYKPFINDPRIVRVAKGQRTASEPAPEAKAQGSAKKEEKSKKDMPPLPAPAPATGTTKTAS